MTIHSRPDIGHRRLSSGLPRAFAIVASYRPLQLSTLLQNTFYPEGAFIADETFAE